MKTATRFVSRLACLLALPAVACFSPERIDPDDTIGAGTKGDDPSALACVELDEPCEQNGDCCDFDAAPEAGTALCVNGGGAATCLEVCTASDDCGSGCCGQLSDVAEYGACMHESACPDYEFGVYSVDRCLQGVETFCSCADMNDVPCTDRASYEQSCQDGPDAVTDVFMCFAGFSDAQCGAALDACG